MIRAIHQALRIPEEEAVAFIQRSGGDIGAAEIILGWTPETQPIEGVRINRDGIQRAWYQCKLTPWAKKWKAEGFLQEATVFELMVTYTINPTYPTVAFRVPLKGCIELARELNMKPSHEMIAYALLVETLLRQKVLTYEAAQVVLQQQGIPWIEPDRLTPFPPDIFEHHVLKDVDVHILAPGQIMQHAPRRGVGVIRERKEMCNRIVKVGTYYQLYEGAEEFVTCILELLKPL
jgi:hypothetical protein